jgi:hypothetical protein
MRKGLQKIKLLRTGRTTLEVKFHEEPFLIVRLSSKICVQKLLCLLAVHNCGLPLRIDLARCK